MKNKYNTPTARFMLLETDVVLASGLGDNLLNWGDTFGADEQEAYYE